MIEWTERLLELYLATRGYSTSRPPARCSDPISSRPSSFSSAHSCLRLRSPGHRGDRLVGVLASRRGRTDDRRCEARAVGRRGPRRTVVESPSGGTGRGRARLRREIPSCERARTRGARRWCAQHGTGGTREPAPVRRAAGRRRLGSGRLRARRLTSCRCQRMRSRRRARTCVACSATASWPVCSANVARLPHRACRASARGAESWWPRTAAMRV